jgi:CBS domain-containing protein
MKVEQLMTKEVRACSPSHPLNCAAQILWESDCGIVPVVSEDDHGRVVGTLTDRDICMAAYTQGKPLYEISVGSAMAQKVYSCTPATTLDEVMGTMQAAQVRRLPVVDEAGQLLGMVSLADLAREAKVNGGTAGLALVGETFASITRPRAAMGSAPPA